MSSTRAQLNHTNQNIEFSFGENDNYLQIGKGYLEFDIGVRKIDNSNFHYDDPIRSVNDAFAFCFKEARLSTTIGSDFEHNKFCGQVSTIMKVISNKDGDLLSHLITITKMIFQFLRELLTYQPKLETHLNKKS